MLAVRAPPSDAPISSPMRSPVPSPATAPVPRIGSPATTQKPLKKKRSIIDHFKLRPREAPEPTPTPQHRPSFVYVPTHAASDFSRISVSPRAPPKHQGPYSYDEQGVPSHRVAALHTITADSSEDGHVVALKRHQPALQTLAEDETTHATRQLQTPPRTSHAEEVTQPQSPSAAKQKSPRSPRHSNTPIPSPPRGTYQAGTSTTAPDESPAQGSQERGDDMPTPNITAEAEHGSQQQAMGPEPQVAAQPAVPETKNEPLSDYELFIARAEAEDRAYRERFLRDLPPMGVTLGGYVTPYYNPLTDITEAPSPYRNSAAYTANLSTGSTAVGPGGDLVGVDPRKTREGRVSMVDSGIGSQGSKEVVPNAKRETDDALKKVAGPPRDPRTRKHASWEPAPELSAWGEGQRRLPTHAAAARVSADNGHGGYHVGGAPRLNLDAGKRCKPGQPERVIRKQASFRQRLGEYIKPSRRPSRYDNAGQDNTGLALA